MKAKAKPAQNTRNLKRRKAQFEDIAQQVIELSRSTDMNDPEALIELQAALDYLRWKVIGPYDWQLIGQRIKVKADGQPPSGEDANAG